VAKPESILGQVKGMARDFSMDSLPKGYVWDLCDYIPQQRGAQLEARAPWAYLTQTALAGTIWSGFDAVFAKAEKLLVHAGGNLYEQPRTTSMSAQANANLIGSLFGSTLHSGRYYLDKVYWADGAGVAVPKSVAWNGSVFTIASLSGANTPKATLLDVFKNRLVSDGGPTVPNAIYWAPADPSTAWDNKAFVGGFPRAITALGAMPQVLIVFHDGLTSRIKGGDHPPATGLASDKVDITRDVLSAQYGCVDPASVVPWQENLVWACSHGIMLTDGSTIRSLTDQGGIGEVWRYLYGLKKTGTQVSAGIYLNMLFVSILTQWDGSSAREDRSFVFVCDLAARTWYRLSNVLATCFIPSTTGAEQLWFGHDFQGSLTNANLYAYRLARISTMYLGLPDIDPDDPNPPASYQSAIDPNGVPILPRITTSWQTLGREGEKRMRNVYISHETQKPNSGTIPVGDPLQIGYRLTPVVLDSWVNIGTIPFSTLYDRKRLHLGRPAYGIQVHVEQIVPSHVSRLYDIAVETYPVDRGRVY